MSAPTPEQRAAWIANMRKILDFLEQHPDLTLPWTSPDHVTFYPAERWNGGNPRREMAAIETTLGIEFEPHTVDMGSSKDYFYILSGDMDGLRIDIKARAADVAVERVTGREVIETKEWVRLPVEDEADKPKGAEAA